MKRFFKFTMLTVFILAILAACSSSDEKGTNEESSESDAESSNESVNVPEMLLSLDDKVELLQIGDEKFSVGDVKEEILRRHMWGQLYDLAHMQVVIDEFPPTKEEIEKELEGNSFSSEKEAEYRAAYKKAILETVEITDEKLESIKETYFTGDSAPIESEDWSDSEWKEYLTSVFPDYYEDSQQVIYEIFEENKENIEVLHKELEEYLRF